MGTLPPKTPQPTNRNLASTVSQVLRQPGLLEMAFQFGNVQVTGMQFSQVAQAVDSGRIKCWTVDEFESQGRDTLPDGRKINAQYDIDGNAMIFSRAASEKLRAKTKPSSTRLFMPRLTLQCRRKRQ